MFKSEIFIKLLDAVVQETEIPSKDILSDNRNMEVVDARYILVFLLYENGIYPSAIAGMINKTKRSVNYILTNFPDRVKSGKIMRIQYEKIKNSIRNN